MPAAVLKIYGAYTSQKALQLHNPIDGFLVLGRAENANEVVENARVFLAPLRFGAGIKGKLAEAMSCGTPSITTSIGAEAMMLGSIWNGFVTDNPEAFADLAVKLYQNKSIWEDAQKNGIEIYNKRFSKLTNESSLIDCVAKVRDNLNKHRMNNFLGEMLQFQSNLSSKYLSKWIAEKNKK